MRLTARQLNRATLARQMLLRRETSTVDDAVRRIAVLQAQEPASPYIALWNRIAGFDAADLDEAFADRTVVKASLIRLTLHTVHADDYPSFHHAMVPSLRGSRLHDDRFKLSELTISEADAMLPDLAAFTQQPRTGTEIEAMIDDRFGRRVERMWWALRMFAPLHHSPTGGPWSFGRSTSVISATTAPVSTEHHASVQHLLLRYLHTFGPASANDFAQFSILRKPIVTAALQALADQLVEMTGPDGSTLYDVADGELPRTTTAAPPRLLPMWDSVLLAYADRDRIVPAAYRSHVIRRNGDVLPTLLVDGYVAGVWRPVDGGIEATAFHPLDAAAWKGLAAEARALVAFLADRDPKVYSRYTHWWAKGMPGADVRVLPG